MATGAVLVNNMRSSYSNMGLHQPVSSKPTFAQTLRRKSTIIARKYLKDEPSHRARTFLNATNYDLEPYMNDSDPASYSYDPEPVDPYSNVDALVDAKPYSYFSRYSSPRSISADRRVQDSTPITQRLFCADDYVTRVTDYRKMESSPLTQRLLRADESSGLEHGMDACHVSSVQVRPSTRSSNILSSSLSKEIPPRPPPATPAPCRFLKSRPASPRGPVTSRAREGNGGLGSTCTARELTRIITEPSGGEYVIPFEPYNEVYPGVYIGDMATALCTQGLIAMGITHVLNAAQKDPRPGQQLPGYYVNTNAAYYRRADIRFLGVPATDVIDFDLSQYFEQAADFIHEALENNGKVLVHCHQGISRSAALVLAFLMLRRGMTAQEAMRTVRAKREVIPNPSFLRQLCELNDRLTGARITRYPRYM